MPYAGSGDALFYQEVGHGHPILFIPGFGGVGSFWTPQIEAFSAHYKVVLHDHRGTGQSSRDLIPYSVAQMARDVLELADGLGIDQFHYAGHSTGAAIGLELALHHRERLHNAVLSSGWARCDPWFSRCFEARATLLREAGPAAYVRAQGLFILPPWWVGKHDAQLTQMEAAQLAHFPPAEIVLSRIVAITSYGPGDALSAITTPALVVCADDDHLTPPHFSMEMHGLIPGSDLAILPTGGHFNTMTRPADFNRTVLSWLQANASGREWQPPPLATARTVHQG